MLFPIKIVFVAFTMFFLVAVIYFMVNSSFVHYRFLEDASEFISWRAYGSKEIFKRWKKIKDKMKAGTEASYKLAVIEADDFLLEIFEEKDYTGENFEEIIKKIDKKMLSNIDQIKEAHEVRNSIVYDSEYKLDTEQAKRILAAYEYAINAIGLV
jgi:hypothetical protein